MKLFRNQTIKQGCLFLPAWFNIVKVTGGSEGLIVGIAITFPWIVMKQPWHTFDEGLTMHRPCYRMCFTEKKNWAEWVYISLEDCEREWDG